MRKKKAFRAFVYLIVGIALLLYAIPQLPAVTVSLEGVYTVIWLLFALLLIGANLYALMNVEKDRRRRQKWASNWSHEVDRVAHKLYQERRRRRRPRSFLR